MKVTKRQVFPAGLWIVATPIGNLEDLTPRARWALEDAQWILCEDTRRTQVLLAALGISSVESRLKRLDAHADEKAIQYWVRVLEQGKAVALVTDAGTPAVSDPGSALVSAAHQAGITVTPVPGVSAVSTLLSVAGFSDAAFTFRGFFPRKKQEQIDEMEQCSQGLVSRVFVWFESPQRICESLVTLESHHPGLSVVVGKELTKRFEKVFAGTSSQVRVQVEQEVQEQGALGEWCFAIEFPRKKNSTLGVERESSPEGGSPWLKALQCLLECEVSPTAAAKKISQAFGVQRKEVYEAALRFSGKK